MANKRRATLVDSYRPIKHFRSSRQTDATATDQSMTVPTKQKVAASIEQTDTMSQNTLFSKRDIFPFLNLPAEVRIRIYELTVDWNGMSTPLSNLRKFAPTDGQLDRERGSYPQKCTICGTFDGCDHPALYRLLRPHCPQRSTPQMLLVCKQITHEALHELHKRPLHLEWPYPITDKSVVPCPFFSLAHFISGRTLRKVPALYITASLMSVAADNSNDLIYTLFGWYPGSSWIPLRNLLQNPDPKPKPLDQEPSRVIQVRFRYHSTDPDSAPSETFTKFRDKSVSVWRERLETGLDERWKVVVGEDLVCHPSSTPAWMLESLRLVLNTFR
jgi:hypothetical protein